MTKRFPISFILSIIRLTRLSHWIKNIAVFAPVVFGGVLFDPSSLYRASIAFIAISFLSSSHYVINDILDVSSDRLHPTKKFRPVAQGTLSLFQAWLVCITYAAIGFWISSALGSTFFGIAVIYSILHYALLFLFRNRRIFDIMTLAIGYALRLIAGEVAIGVHISVWLTLTAFCLSLLFAIGKRRYDAHAKKSHQSEEMYTVKLLDTYLAMFATATIVSYAYFTFLTTFAADAADSGQLGLLSGRKWLMVTIPFVLYGIMRYLQRMYVIEQKGSYQQLLLEDRPLLFSVIGWGITVLIVIYGIGR
jgi:4-hydroxybenzoate polyprenyltransferase